MDVQRTDNTLFQSRNQTIRFADDIARRVNTCYPRISPSKIIELNSSVFFPVFMDRIVTKVLKPMRFIKNEMYEETDSFYQKIRAFTEPVKQFKVGNCGESAQLAAIVAKINGLKDCHITHLCKMDGEDLDHAILFVNDSQKPYIIDPWLGIADYAKNILNRYRNEYRYELGIKNNDKVTLVSKTDDEYTDFLKNDFSRKQINKLRKMYPNLFIKRGYV